MGNTLQQNELRFYEVAKSRYDYNRTTGIFTNKRLGSTMKPHKKHGYVHITVSLRSERKVILAHRLAWYIVYGEVPSELDHINRVRDDNSIDNLRSCNRTQNSMNRRVRGDNTSGFTGVHYDKKTNKWIARININGKRKRVSYSTCPAVALSMRKIAENKYYGDYKPNTKELVK